MEQASFSNAAPISQDEFQALEEKVLRAVEIVRRERDARAAAEAEAARQREIAEEQTKLAEEQTKLAEEQTRLVEEQRKLAAEQAELAQEQQELAQTLRAQLDALTNASNSAQTQITTLNQERDAVRARVEKMMQQIDQLL